MDTLSMDIDCKSGHLHLIVCQPQDKPAIHKWYAMLNMSEENGTIKCLKNNNGKALIHESHGFKMQTFVVLELLMYTMES